VDDADRAVQTEESRLDRVLAERRAQRAARLATAANDGLMCLGCGKEIPEARRRAVPGCCLCVDCQDDAERSMGR
jgi:phage/conjugal plasmid C-4 type zinc finger TraR family protein